MRPQPQLVGAVALGVGGCAVISTALLLPVPDTWTRLIGAITLLGLVGLAALGRQRAAVLRPRLDGVLLGMVAAAAVYAAAWGLAQFAPVAAQARQLYRWRAGHSAPWLAATLMMAVLGEELFWRAAVLRLLLARLSTLAAVLVGTTLYALAHVASGMWLLPMAALGAGLVWAFLFALTRNLTASVVSHLLFDVLVLLVAPLA